MKILEIIKYIKSDLYRYSGKVTFLLFLRQYVRNRSFKYTFWFRMCKSDNVFINLFSRLIYKNLSNKYHLQIPWQTKIGYGLYIGHHMCIVIHPTTIIGDNCNLSQFTTIGSNIGKAAEIGDCVYIGPNCCIVENVKIGNYVSCGAGCVIVKDIEDNASVGGVPAKIISYKLPGRYIDNKWNIRY